MILDCGPVSGYGTCFRGNDGGVGAIHRALRRWILWSGRGHRLTAEEEALGGRGEEGLLVRGAEEVGVVLD